MAQKNEPNQLTGERVASTVPGIYLTKYLCGILQSEGAHRLTIAAIYKRFLYPEAQDVKLDIAPDQFEALLRARVEVQPKDLSDLPRSLQGKGLGAKDYIGTLPQTILFLLGASNLTMTNLAETVGTDQPNISTLLHPEKYREVRYSLVEKLTGEPNPLYLPRNELGKIDPEIVRIIWEKTRALGLALGLNNNKPLLPPSHNLVEAVLLGAEAAYADYEAGNRPQSALPRVGEIMQTLLKISPETGNAEETNTTIPSIKRSRLNTIFYNEVVPTEQEITTFCNVLKLGDRGINLLNKLPSGVSGNLEHYHPTYILKTPEHYETFGDWVKAIREASGMSVEEAAGKLGITRQRLQQLEAKPAYGIYAKGTDGQTFPEKLLQANPFGIFPDTREFRNWFIALSQTSVMEQQYDAAQQWKHQDAVRAELNINIKNPDHQQIIRHWREDVSGLEKGCTGSIVTQAGKIISVRRGQDGDIYFSSSGLEALRKEFGISMAKPSEK